MLPDSRWQCRTRWESCKISPELQRSKVKFSFPVFFFPACPAPRYNFEEDFTCRHNSVNTLLYSDMGPTSDLCRVSWRASSACNRLCFLAGILSVASLSNIPCIELQLSLLWVGFLQLSAKDIPFIFSCFFHHHVVEECIVPQQQIFCSAHCTPCCCIESTGRTRFVCGHYLSRSRILLPLCNRSLQFLVVAVRTAAGFMQTLSQDVGLS